MLTEEQIQSYERDGFLVVKELLSLEECEKLKSVVHRLIDEWEPETDYSYVFSEGGGDGRTENQQLTDSGDKISFFIAKQAIDRETGKLNRDKHQSMSMIGHALHVFEPEFKKVAFAGKIKTILHDLQFIKPALRQSLYIFKQSLIGDAVVAHRDSMYVYNDPFNVMGIWIALEDATIHNGCLSFIPGSHSKPAQQRMIRNPNEKEFNEGRTVIYIGEKEQFDANAFVPVEVKAGDAILIHGNVVHQSEENKSPVSRQICAFHFFETHKSVYSKSNWLQLPTSFPLVYDE